MSDTKPRCMLVIDDDSSHCKLMNDMGRLMGYKVDSYQCFEDVISGVELSLYNVITIDLSMPKVDGVQALSQLARRNVKAPIIIISGKETEIISSSRSSAEKHGLRIVGTLRKPFKMAAFENILRQVEAEEESSQSVAGKTNHPKLYEIERFVEEDRIVCLFQPRVDLRSGSVKGVEVLSRIEHPKYGVIEPEFFISMIENLPFMARFNEKMFVEAFLAYQTLMEKGFDLNFSINIPAYSVCDQMLPDNVAIMTDALGIPASRFTFEITETQALLQLADNLDIMTRLRLKGFGLSIEGFGFKQASIEQIKSIPCSELKIDKNVTANIIADKQAQALFKDTIKLANQLQITTVARGIESAAVASEVRALGCQDGQGFFFARPMRLAALREWLSDNRQPSVDNNLLAKGRGVPNGKPSLRALARKSHKLH